MAQGLGPAFHCLSQECLLSRRKKRAGKQKKVRLVFKSSAAAGGQDESWPLGACSLARSFGLAKQSSVRQT